MEGKPQTEFKCITGHIRTPSLHTMDNLELLFSLGKGNQKTRKKPLQHGESIPTRTQGLGIDQTTNPGGLGQLLPLIDKKQQMLNSAALTEEMVVRVPLIFEGQSAIADMV